ncbi:hypothetical protein VP01_761g12 [Puccinia sorghi]|uniref:PQ-loop-domain-containing protein n=1 Tax=Puccinia sorghi TaxID=27349 RepID=A0A0L6UBY5_9BASI|nr:hypothetical protein VP01_761g12 [Puccinia sorghi]
MSSTWCRSQPRLLIIHYPSKAQCAIYENYLYKSGEGVSVSFVAIWMIGDLTNLFGAVKQHLLQTMIVLSVYYTLCDLVLLLQIFHYRRYHRNKAEKQISQNAPGSEAATLAPDDSQLADAETSPLLARADNSERLESTQKYTHKIGTQVYRALNYCSQGLPSYFTVYGLILVIGLLGWSISQAPHSDPQDPRIMPTPPPPSGGESWDTTAQIMGWISAFAYLSSRIPQIFKNQVTKCHGLSLLFFLLQTKKNVISRASDPSPNLTNARSWLVGSGGTIFLDLIVLYQFWSYRNERFDPPTLREDDNSS